MAATDKNILITPNRGVANVQPTMSFVGNVNAAMTLRVADDNSLSFENATGQLFSIANNVTTGTIFSVNDISGIPVINVNASGNISLNPLGGANVGIGTASPQYSLDVYGNIRISSNISVVALTTATGTNSNLTVDPDGTGWLITSPSTQVAVQNTAISTSTVTGALTVAGGVGVTGNLFTAASAWHGNLAITNTTISTSTTTGALTVAGGVGITGNVIIGNTLGIKAYTETVAAPSISANTLNIDLWTGSVFNVALTSSVTTFNIVNTTVTSGNVSNFVLIFTANGSAFTVAWPGSVRWPGGTAPTLTSTNGKRDVMTFFSVDNGTSWNSFISGQNL